MNKQTTRSSFAFSMNLPSALCRIESPRKEKFSMKIITAHCSSFSIPSECFPLICVGSPMAVVIPPESSLFSLSLSNFFMTFKQSYKLLCVCVEGI